MPSIDEQVHEFYDIVADLRVGSELLEEAAAENMKKRERYLNLCESKDRTAEEENVLEQFEQHFGELLASSHDYWAEKEVFQSLVLENK